MELSTRRNGKPATRLNRRAGVAAGEATGLFLFLGVESGAQRTPMALHPTFEKFLEPLLDQKIPLGVRLQYASREIRLTLEANELLKTAGDKQGVQVGEEYLRAIENILAKDGIKLGAAKAAPKWRV